MTSLKVALRSLGSNKLRTFLTMLGVIIGVGAVIAMLAIGQGASQRISQSINSMGTNLLTVSAGNFRIRGGFAGGGQEVPKLVPADADAIKRNLGSTVRNVAPAARSNVTLKMGNQNSQSNLVGTVPEYVTVNNVKVMSGRFLNDNDNRGKLKVAVVGPTVVTNLLGDEKADPVGMTVEINRIRFKIIGVLESKGAAAFGRDQDDIVIIPLDTALRRVLNQTFVNNIYVECTSMDKMKLADEQITSLLRRRHHLSPPFPDNDDFRVRNQAELLQVTSSVSGTMTALLGGVAVVSLIVGGIGIMNIMIVSVTERTREIGLRKAVGATESDILTQFLTEAIVVSVLGGLIGIGAGIGGSKLVEHFLGWATVVKAQSVILAFVVAAAIGLFFGIYPARKAAKLNPIDALRWE